jgi:hypothetical protein
MRIYLLASRRRISPASFAAAISVWGAVGRHTSRRKLRACELGQAASTAGPFFHSMPRHLSLLGLSEWGVVTAKFWFVLKFETTKFVKVF